MKKRIFTLFLALTLLYSMVSCGKKAKDEPKDESAFLSPSLNDSQIEKEENSTAGSKEDTNSSDSKEDNMTPDDQNTTYDPDSWVNPGSLTSPYAIVNAAAKASPSVVAITTETVSYNGFYGNYVSEGAGSGVIYTSDGYIITNNHVIEGADTVRVTLINGDTYDATIIGADIVTDIAVLKIEASGLEAANPAQEELLVGQPVIAIGNPMGSLSGTVTSGIVSALSRTISVEGIAMELLQFDAAVSPGNSGGGLFDINGNLVAVVNAKSSGDGVEGISFAIPAARALEITEQFIKQGYISDRPGTGIETKCIDANNYESFRDSELWNYAVIGSRVYTGLYITDTQNTVYADTQNTFLFGDRITQIGVTEITNESDITAALSRYQIGDSVTVKIARLTEVSTPYGNSYTYRSYDINIVLIEYRPAISGGTIL
ncbi:MAG: trypsin-like serine protease [Ruminococcaceae bacterium]|nr:trypsin-like serine protease [Oscillospiraceae bacterium]